MDIENTKHLLLKRGVLLMCFSIVLALLVRPLLVKMDLIFTLVGLANFALTLLFYFYLSRTNRKPWHPFLMLVVFLIVLIPLLLISGGVYSQFVALIPIIPLFLCLIGDSRVSQISAISLVGVIILITLLGPAVLDLTLDNNSAQKTYSRAFWLCVACGWSAYFGNEFDRLTSKLTRQLEQQALFDGLTKVANRRSILKFLELEVDRQKQLGGWVSVLMVDVDHFKTINDRFGHLFGDFCLKQVAETIQNCVLSGTGKVGRYGGEEFLIVLGNSNLYQTKKTAEEICEAISKILTSFDNENVSLTATLGCCSRLSTDVNDIDELIKNADDALYRGKRLDRNRVVSSKQGESM